MLEQFDTAKLTAIVQCYCMPTPESAEAFAKLVAARTRLTEITKQLNEANAGPLVGQAARAAYASLQAEWEATFRAFEIATEEFSDNVKHLHDEMKSRQNKT